jgi:hypothetical protein
MDWQSQLALQELRASGVAAQAELPSLSLSTLRLGEKACLDNLCESRIPVS